MLRFIFIHLYFHPLKFFDIYLCFASDCQYLVSPNTELVFSKPLNVAQNTFCTRKEALFSLNHVFIHQSKIKRNGYLVRKVISVGKKIHVRTFDWLLVQFHTIFLVIFDSAFCVCYFDTKKKAVEWPFLFDIKNRMNLMITFDCVIGAY